MPVFEAVTTQVNIEIFVLAPTPLPLLVQVIPNTPVIDHVPYVAKGLKLGLGPLEGPVTVAVKVNWLPIFTVGVLVVTTTTGRDLETTGEIPEDVDATGL